MRGKAISEQVYQEIVEAEKRTTDKRLSKKLSILLLRFGGKSIAEPAEQMNCSVSKVRRLIAEYRRDGLSEYLRSKYAGNHRSLSIEEENEILSSFEKKADAGQIITVQGTIDCYFPEEDGIVLVDYKSNFVDNRREEEDVQRLVRWYEPQLQMYRKALETISGCHVKQMYLYLFSAGKAMELPVSGKERSQNGTAEE